MAPSRARENRPLVGSGSPFSRFSLSLGATRNLEPETRNHLPQLGTPRSIARAEAPVPHLVPDCTALYGLNRDKKIFFIFKTQTMNPHLQSFVLFAFIVVKSALRNPKSAMEMALHFSPKPYMPFNPLVTTSHVTFTQIRAPLTRDNPH